MLGTNQLDFMSYATALKSNYRKGVRKLEAILANPSHAAEFAANLGGVSVVLGVPIGREDRNSEALLSLLLNSDIADDAVLTWMHQFYEFTTWDDLMGNSARVQEMMNNPLLWRALGGSKKAVGKGVATLAGLSCASYADIVVVVASSTAMAAVAASQTAMAAVIGNATALNAVVSSQTAMAAVATAWETTESIITSSSVALNALKNSGKCETIKKDVSGAKSISFYSGLCFVFTAQITVTGDRCAIKATRPTGSSTLTLCSSVTMTTVNKFCKDPYVQCTDSGHNYANNYLYCYKI